MLVQALAKAHSAGTIRGFPLVFSCEADNFRWHPGDVLHCATYGSRMHIVTSPCRAAEPMAAVVKTLQQPAIAC